MRLRIMERGKELLELWKQHKEGLLPGQTEGDPQLGSNHNGFLGGVKREGQQYTIKREKGRKSIK